MTFFDLLRIASLVIASLGGSGMIVFALSSWLGKVWADRLMQKQRAIYEREIEEFKAETLRLLEREKAIHQQELETFKAQLVRDSDLAAQTLRERLALYKDSIAPILDIYAHIHTRIEEVDAETWQDFEHKRLVVAATLGMFAPLPVFERYNDTVDYLQDCREGSQHFDFSRFRQLGFYFIDAVRRDLGIHTEPLAYYGPR